MTKDEFIQAYSRFGHRTDPTHGPGLHDDSFRRWNLDKVHEYFDAVPCDCGAPGCQDWKMRAKMLEPPEDCSIDPMTMFGPLGPPFTMIDPEQPAITFTSSDDEIQPINKWKPLAHVKPAEGQLVEYRGVNPECMRKSYSAIGTVPRQGHFVKDCGTHWTENLNGFTTEKLGVICAPDPEITLWRAVIDRGKDMILNSEHCVPVSIPAVEFGEPNSGLASKEPIGLRFADFPFHWSFILDGKTIGELTFNEKTEKLDFSGNAHGSAQILFDLVTEHFEIWHKEKYRE